MTYVQSVDPVIDGFRTDGNLDLNGGRKIDLLVPEMFLIGELATFVANEYERVHGPFVSMYGDDYKVIVLDTWTEYPINGDTPAYMLKSPSKWILVISKILAHLSKETFNYVYWHDL